MSLSDLMNDPRFRAFFRALHLEPGRRDALSLAAGFERAAVHSRRLNQLVTETRPASLEASLALYRLAARAAGLAPEPTDEEVRRAIAEFAPELGELAEAHGVSQRATLGWALALTYTRLTGCQCEQCR